ncbi:DEAD-box type RNA helicase [Rhizina undulata]
MADEGEAVNKALVVIANLPDEVHWLCGKIENGSNGQPVKCDADEATRVNSAIHSLMLFSYTGQEASQEWLTDKFKFHLLRCSRCVEQFYLFRKRLYLSLLEEHEKHNLDLFFSFLLEWDSKRVNPVLSSIIQDLETAPSVDEWYKRFQDNTVQKNAIHEILCNPALLQIPEVKDNFKRICAIKELRIESPVYALVSFLFQPDDTLVSLAQKSWEVVGPSITPEIFESNLLEPMEAGVAKAETDFSLDALRRLWTGLGTIVGNLQKEVIMKCICGAKSDPIKLAVSRIPPSIAYLVPYLHLFDALMAKLGFEFWDVVSPLSSSTFSELIINDRQFLQLISTTPQDESGEAQLVDITKWMSSFMSTIRPLQRPTNATPLLRFLFKEDKPPLSRGICLKEGMKVLSLTLSGVFSQSSIIEGEGDRIILRQANNLFNEHLALVITVGTASSQIYAEGLMERHLKIAHKAAGECLLSALKLDVKVLKTDFTILSKKKPELPMVQTTFRTILWNDICDKFPSNDVQFAQQIISGVADLVTIETFHISDSDVGDVRSMKENFNRVIKDIEVPLFKIFRKISHFSAENVKQILSKEDPRHVVLYSLLSPADKISNGAEDIILQAYGAEEKSQALRAMILDKSDTMTTVNSICRHLSKEGTYLVMSKLIRFSAILLEVLCDPYEGLIATELAGWQQTMLRVYWDVQWRCLMIIFKKCRRWSFTVDKNAMIEFTRDTMDYAGNLFDKYWTFEQALRANPSEIDSNSSREVSWGKRLLQDASKCLSGLTSILTIQDPHLLSTCQALMCKILKLLDQNGVKIDDESFFDGLRKTLYPETEPGYDPNKPKTNLTDVQRAEISVAVSSHFPGFVPVGKFWTKTRSPPLNTLFANSSCTTAKPQTIEISDDEYGLGDDFDLVAYEKAEAEMLKTGGEATRKTAQRKQTKLNYSIRPSRKETIPSRSITQTTNKSSVLDQLRVGSIKEGGSIRAPKGEEIAQLIAKRKAEKAAKEAARAKREAKNQETPTTVVLGFSSSEESSSEDEGDDIAGLFNQKTTMKSTQITDDPRLTASIKPQVQVRRNAAPVRRVKDNRARVAPDLSPLYKQILKWELFHDSPFPPGLSAENYTSVAKHFNSYDAYHKTFEPLLLLEAWQQFLKAKEENTGSAALEVKLVSRLRADNFVELETTIANLNERNRLVDSDIVLLSPARNPLNSTNEPHCLARVHSINRKFTGAPVTEVQFRCDPPSVMMQNHMRNGGTLHAVKLTGLVPLEREYSALICLQYYDLRDEILKAVPSESEYFTESQVNRTKNLYSVNEPQAKAILSAVKNTGFTLIQGPPGTGKTKTVIGIVGALLTPADKVVAIQIPGATASKPVPKPSTKKILVCAPSNAAVDELVIRFKQGVRTTRGDDLKPAIVRVGRTDVINADVKDVTLEELIERRMAPMTDAANGKTTDIEALRKKYNELMDERNKKQKELEDARSKSMELPVGLQADLDKLNATLRDQRRELNEKRDQKKENSRNAEVLRRRVQQEIMDEAQIICATLSGSGHEMLRNVNVDFETVIIDEAAQSVELSALIPLKFGCEKCILVGDPKQLPPTVLSREAAKFSYEKSLFVRMQENRPKDVHLLSIQYRMHPAISIFPSKEFYDSELKDGDGMAALRNQPWHSSTVFGPYRFFNVLGRESTGGRTSLINTEEVNMAIALVERMRADFSEIDFDGKIGIITPYKQQLYELKRRFSGRFGEQIVTCIEFNTTDAFQGREREIIIFSCVRASPEGGIGFLSDVRRMNVGLTRAKSSLFVLGNSASLMRNTVWRGLVEDAKARGVFTDGNLRALFGKSTRIKGGSKAIASSSSMSCSAGKENMGQPDGQNAAPTANMQVGRVDDPMDIDMPDDDDVLMQNAPPSNPIQEPRNVEPPRKPAAARKKCYNCNQEGHLRSECPEQQKGGPRHNSGHGDNDNRRRPSSSGSNNERIVVPKNFPGSTPHNPNMPTPASQSLKRHAETGEDGGNAKRPHIAPDAGAGGSEPLPKKPMPPVQPRKVIQRKDTSANVFIQPKRPRRPPGPGGNSTG